MAMATIRAPSPSRQIAFYQLLVAARKTWLLDALGQALKRTDPRQTKAQASSFIPPDAQKILAAAGIRDEYVFPLPIVLEEKPSLVGYYRLLLGSPQKTFYGGGTGMGQFKSMETHGSLSEKQRDALPDFCRAMAGSLADLVRQMSPKITDREINDLPLLTFGAQLQGANNTKIGRQATENVYGAVDEILKRHIIRRKHRRLTIKNAAGRRVSITLAGDPDLSVQEDVAGNLQNRVAIEIKGGTDKSNAYNRAGEAEKSHQKAKKKGYRDFWTVISIKGVDRQTLESGSPTTNSWFDAAQVLGREGEDWEEFRRRLAAAVGIPLKP